MSSIKKHQCPSCGGSLTVDNEKQMYRCTSCGSSYDYDYFREEKLHEMGETNLSRNEFGAAADAYRLLLKKDPHDFQALRGLMLAAANLKDMDGLVRKGDSKSFSYDPKLVSEVLGSASEEDKEYFEKLAKIYSDLKDLAKLYSEIRSLKSEKDRIENTLSLEEFDQRNYVIPTGYFASKAPRPTFIALWLLDLFLFIVLLCIVVPLLASGATTTALVFGFFFVFFIGLIAFVNMTEIYPEVKEAKGLGDDVTNLQIELSAATAKLGKLKSDAEELSADIKDSINDFVEKDRQIMSAPVQEKAKEPVSVSSKIKKHQCPSCGGSLRVDSDTQMYHCTFCGSSYDYEYFKEDKIHEAGETYLSRGEFMATADAYEFMLKKDPHDFLALRGLMLAAAHMTNMNELDHEIEKEDFSYDPEMVKQAIESALEEDKEYFKELARVYSEKKQLIGYAKEIEDLRKEKSKINSAIAHNNIMRENYYIRGEDGTKLHPKPSFIIMSCVTAFFLMVTVICAFDLAKEYAETPDHVAGSLSALITFGVLTLGLGTYNFCSYFFKTGKMKKIDDENSQLYVESGKMDEKIRDLEDRSAKLLNDLKRSIHEFVKKDRLIMK